MAENEYYMCDHLEELKQENEKLREELRILRELKLPKEDTIPDSGIRPRISLLDCSDVDVLRGQVISERLRSKKHEKEIEHLKRKESEDQAAYAVLRAECDELKEDKMCLEAKIEMLEDAVVSLRGEKGPSITQYDKIHTLINDNERLKKEKTKMTREAFRWRGMFNNLAKIHFSWTNRD